MVRFPPPWTSTACSSSDDDGVWLFAEHISLRWSPSALLFRHVKVDSLHVGLLHIERAAASRQGEKAEQHALDSAY